MQDRQLSSFIDGFKGKNVAVIGDIALDSYIYGVIERINPEMPSSPLLKVQKIENTLGCAGNVAYNLASLGASVSLYGIIGADAYKKIILKKCKQKSIRLFYAVEGKTMVKQRVKEENHQSYITRVDFGELDLAPMKKSSEEVLLK